MLTQLAAGCIRQLTSPTFIFRVRPAMANVVDGQLVGDARHALATPSLRSQYSTPQNIPPTPSLMTDIDTRSRFPVDERYEGLDDLAPPPQEAAASIHGPSPCRRTSR